MPCHNPIYKPWLRYGIWADRDSHFQATNVEPQLFGRDQLLLVMMTVFPSSNHAGHGSLSSCIDWWCSGSLTSPE